MNSGTQNASATLPIDRILSIDILRGVAVLGILLLNIQSFSMVSSAYINPTNYGDLTGVNLWVWILSHVLASEKFITIFSILFGAGVILLYERKLSQQRHPGKVHYWRNFWLLLFGLVHAYFIWYGDILVAYSLCGFFVFLFRKMKPKGLLLLASGFFLIPVFINVMSGLSIPYWPEESVQETMKSWAPSQEAINEEITAMLGSFTQQMEFRIPQALFFQTFLFFFGVFWRVVAMMLIGMALFKSGVLLAKKSSGFYIRMILICLPIGYLLSSFGVWKNFENNWTMEYSMFIGNLPNYFGSLSVALAYIAIVMLIAKSLTFNGFKRVFSAVGKMAFTNYILMSIIGGIIFYGHGFGLFGKVERTGQLFITLAIWTLMMIISPLWLKKFNYGPLEWLWRSLTYRKVLAFRKTT